MSVRVYVFSEGYSKSYIVVPVNHVLCEIRMVH